MRDGWVKVRLGEVAFTRSPDGVSPPGEPYVGLEHFDSGDPTLRRWSDTADVTSATTPFEPRDVLFGKLRPYLRKVAVPHFAGRCTNRSLVYHAATPELMQDFLAVVLRSDIALAHASVTTGTRMPRTSAKSMANLEFPLPPIEEQRRIVDLMKATDAVVESLREELKTLTATHLACSAGGMVLTVASRGDSRFRNHPDRPLRKSTPSRRLCGGWGCPGRDASQHG